jgi:hypothetical protein
MEVWKDIKGYEGIYQVSNLGRVKSLARIVVKAYGAEHRLSERIKKTNLNHLGYEILRLHNGSGKTFAVHRLVAEAFLNKTEGLEVNHIDGDKTNNKVSNLEYCTRSQNIQHAYDNGLAVAVGTKGFDSTSSKILLDTQTGIFYGGIREASEAMGLHPRNLYNVFSAKTVKNKTNLIIV